MRLPVAMVAAVALIALAGCGSSKPSYCSDRTNLENSIKNLPSVTSSSGISGLKTQITTIQSDATSLVNAAKSDFPTQTSAREVVGRHAPECPQSAPVEPFGYPDRRDRRRRQQRRELGQELRQHQQIQVQLTLEDGPWSTRSGTESPADTQAWAARGGHLGAAQPYPRHLAPRLREVGTPNPCALPA